MTLSRRLDRLDGCWRPAPTMPALDFSALTPDEIGELDIILAKLEGVPRRGNGKPDFSPLSDAEVERLGELAELITTQETP